MKQYNKRVRRLVASARKGVAPSMMALKELLEMCSERQLKDLQVVRDAFDSKNGPRENWKEEILAWLSEQHKRDGVNE